MNTKDARKIRTINLLILLITILAVPNGANAGKEKKPMNESQILAQEMVDGPTNYTTSQSKTAAGDQVNFSLPKGKSFSYVDGKSITLNDGKDTVVITIDGSMLDIGNKVCESHETDCIVHAIRSQAKGFTNHDSAQASAILRNSTASLQFGARITEILIAHATMPRTRDDDDDGHKHK